LIHEDIASFVDDMKSWRQDIHAHPETAFEEFRTSDLVAEKLVSFGIEVHRGLAGTGVVGVLKGTGGDGGAIGLRADMDALDIEEQTNLEYRSKNAGKMHACGHDGHTTMLLGAARHLSENRDFAGIVHFIFQPAEENEGGGQKMVEDGLFEQFPMDQVYGLHNWPGMPVGQMGVRAGPVMASTDTFEIIVTGKGAHAAMPHQGIDTIVTAAEIVCALQTIASRMFDPVDPVVVSVTQFHGGDTWNVIPEEVVLRGTVRAFNNEVQNRLEPAIKKIASGIAEAHGASVTLRYERGYPPTVNSERETGIAANAAARLVGQDNVLDQANPSMGAEDFAFLLQEKPGAYAWIGAGEDHINLHNPAYDFNDDLLPLGASYWVNLVTETLGAESANSD
jgi:amidohydrolase